MFALVLGLLYALIIVAFIWYLPLALSLLGSFLALLVIVSFAQWMKPSKKSDWLLTLGCGLLGGAATALILWPMLGPGVINLPMLLVLVLAAGLAGPTGGALRWAFDMLWPRLRRGRAVDMPEQPPTPASTSLSRRDILLGLGGLAGLAVTGASFTWLARSLLAHAFPLVTHKSLDQVHQLSWSPDGKRIISALGEKFEGGQITIWDAATGKETFSAYNANVKGYFTIQAVAWSPDGTRIALGSEAGLFLFDNPTGLNTAIIDAATLRPIVTLSAGKLEAGVDVTDVLAIAWPPDSTRIAAAAGETQVWDAATGKQLLSLKSGLFVLAWSPDGRYLVTDNQNDAQVWDAESGALLTTYHGHSNLIQAVTWSPDSTEVASSSFDSTVQVWDARTGRHLLTYRGTAPGDDVLAVARSPDGRRIASAGFANDVHVWDAATGELVFLYKGHRGNVNTLAWSPDGTRIASGSDDNTAQIWQPE